MENTLKMSLWEKIFPFILWAFTIVLLNWVFACHLQVRFSITEIIMMALVNLMFGVILAYSIKIIFFDKD